MKVTWWCVLAGWQLPPIATEIEADDLHYKCETLAEALAGKRNLDDSLRPTDESSRNVVVQVTVESVEE